MGDDRSLRITVDRNPSEAKLNQLNIKCWPKGGGARRESTS
ncbi:hypothetical protein LINPERHAP1_LOCUS27703 [Linum perenne]